MNVLVVSCNHHKAGVKLRERLAFSSAEQLTSAYAQWRLRHPESEIVVLSTCNRVEIYAADERDNDGVSFDDITRFGILLCFASISAAAFALLKICSLAAASAPSGNGPVRA